MAFRPPKRIRELILKQSKEILTRTEKETLKKLLEIEKKVSDKRMPWWF